MKTAVTGTIALGTAVALAGCGAGGGHGSQPVTDGGQASHATAETPPPPQSPHQQCIATVDSLIEQTISAVEDGYPLGLDPNSVMDRYGEKSAVFQAFSAVNGQVINFIAMHGPAGAYESVAGQVPQLCSEYGELSFDHSSDLRVLLQHDARQTLGAPRNAS